MDKIVLGFAPTRRSIFSAPDAVKYADLTRKKLDELKINYIDITEFNDEGLLYSAEDMEKIAEKFKREKIDGLFVPHCNFGTEYIVAELAKKLDVPVLLWGPRDERPDEKGIRLRDTQCGLFATGKVLRRYGVKFTYLKNCRLEDDVFKNGLENFIRVCNVVKAFKNTRVLQISTRPYDFMTTMCNEGELLEKFGIALAPIPMTELVEEMKAVPADIVKETIKFIKENMDIQIEEKHVETVARLKEAMFALVKKYRCNSAAIQCWNALQKEIGIMPCTANAIMTDLGIPVACETDIHGAISSVLVGAATLNKNPSLFCDWTVRHPDNENGELLQHCGPWPLSIAKTKPVLGYPLAFDNPGAVEAQYPMGKLTIARFDGDNGEYSMLLGNADVIDGPFTKGTYIWIEVDNLDRLEDKIVTGPYVHHCSAVYDDVVAVLYEACKYIGVTPDLYDPVEEEIKTQIRGGVRND